MIEHKLGIVWHVDDNPRERDLISTLLTAEGHHVVSSSSFREAVGMIPDGIRDVDVAIIDSNLGDENGSDLVQLIRDTRLPIAIVRFSAEIVTEGDIFFDKGRPDRPAFIKVINELVEKSHSQHQI